MDAARAAAVSATFTRDALGIEMLRQQTRSDAAAVSLLETATRATLPPGTGARVDRSV